MGLVLVCRRAGNDWQDTKWAQLWRDLLEAQAAGLPQLPTNTLATAFLRTLLHAGRYSLAASMLPPLQQQEQQAGAEEYYYDDEEEQAAAAAAGQGRGAVAAIAAATGAPAAAVAAMKGSSPSEASVLSQSLATPPLSPRHGGVVLGGLVRPADGGRFGVRAALHQAAGAAVTSTAQLVGRSADLVGRSAGLVGRSAQLVQDTTTNLLVKPGQRGFVVGATAANFVGTAVKGTAQLVGTAAGMAVATAAAAAAVAAAGERAATAAAGGGVRLVGAAGLLSFTEAEAVVIEVSKELLYSVSSLEDQGIEDAKLCLLLLLPYDSAAAYAEMDTIAVLQRLPEFGVVLLPAELQALPDKKVVLQQVLTHRAVARPSAGGSSGGAGGAVAVAVPPWRRLGDVLELAQLLGMGEEEGLEVRSVIQKYFGLLGSQGLSRQAELCCCLS